MNRRPLLALATLFGLLGGLPGQSSPQPGHARAEEPSVPSVVDAESPPTLPKQPLNLKMKTLGGKQLWGDVLYFRGWEIQQNVITKHYRLLDEHDYRHAWGTYDACLAKLHTIRQQKKLAPMSGEVVILLHGIVRSSKAMGRMQADLQDAGFLVAPFDYPSTRVDLAACAAYLDRVIRSLEGVERISFVAHSMGGLVVRRWMADFKDDRIHRLVMLGSPNKGAELADQLKERPLFRLLLGPSGQQLVSGPEGVIAQLPTPKIPFAVIAGAKGTPQGYNPLITGDDDGVVSVDSALLPGAADYLGLPVMHTMLPLNKQVIGASRRFIQTGSLRESGPRQPIAAQPPITAQAPATASDAPPPAAKPSE